MQFRLRTLLIVVTVLAVVLARVAYLKRQRDFHRHEVHRVSTRLAAFHNRDWREIEQSVSVGAADGPGARRVVPTMTPEQLASYENGIWMCYRHGKLIDTDEEKAVFAEIQDVRKNYVATRDAVSAAKKAGDAEGSRKLLDTINIRNQLQLESVAIRTASRGQFFRDALRAFLDAHPS